MEESIVKSESQPSKKVGELNLALQNEKDEIQKKLF